MTAQLLQILLPAAIPLLMGGFITICSTVPCTLSNETWTERFTCWGFVVLACTIVFGGAFLSILFGFHGQDLSRWDQAWELLK